MLFELRRLARTRTAKRKELNKAIKNIPINLIDLRNHRNFHDAHIVDKHCVGLRQQRQIYRIVAFVQDHSIPITTLNKYHTLIKMKN